MRAKEEQLKLLSFWKSLSPSEQELVIKNTGIKKYAKNELLHTCGMACIGLIHVLSGSIRGYLLSEEGREVTLFIDGQGESCVLSASCIFSQITFETQLVALTDCELMILEVNALQQLVDQNIYVRSFMYETMTVHYSDTMWSMQQILFHKFDRRLAEFLLTEARREHSNELHMTHEEIARLISSAREVVARMMKRFAQEGYVTMSRGTVKLKNIKALKVIAGE